MSRVATSAAGVNHRSWNRGAAPAAEESRRRKAVWERLNSEATDCIHRSSAALAASSRRHTAAGLPLNGPAVKASTCDDHGDDVRPPAREIKKVVSLQESTEQYY